MVKLTRYLYFLHDVKYSFITSLLKSDDIKEVIFWLSELYYSGYYELIYNLIWKIYYDFYAISNPLFESKINMLETNLLNSFNDLSMNDINIEQNIKLEIKSIDDGDDEDEVEIKRLLYIINLLFNSESLDNRVFELRFLNVIKPKRMENKNLKWLITLKSHLLKNKIKINQYEELFIKSVHYQIDENIKYYLIRINENNAYHILKIYYKKIKKIPLIEKKESINYLNNILYYDKEHIILALICYFELDNNEFEMEIKGMSEDFNHYLYFKNTNNIKNISPRNILKNKRNYKIDENIGCFINNKINKKTILLNYWEYYANFSPIWEKRFKKYNCKFQNKNPYFNSDNSLENFYKKYGYEPDEQNIKTQEKSLCKIKNIKIEEWLSYVFECEIELTYKINNISY